MLDEVVKFLESHQSDMRKDILKLVAVHSVSEDRAGARRALGVFLGMAEGAGFSVRVAAGGDVGIAAIGPDIPGPYETLGILAHVDVVDPGDPSAWSRSPWGELADGAVWGRGTLDDKGPLVLCLWAAKALRALGIPFRKRLTFIIGTMEEIDWEDMRRYLKDAQPPDFGFTPDGEFPVINREKGYCDVALSFDRSVHGSLGAYSIESFEAGVSANAVPDFAIAHLRPRASGEKLGAVSELKAVLANAPDSEGSFVAVEPGEDGLVVVKAGGTAVHSSVPERGQNAMIRLAAFLSMLGRNGLVDFLTENFKDDPHARRLGLQTRPEYAQGEYIGPTSASPDMARTTQTAFVVTINLRLSFGQTQEELASVFEAGRERYGYSFRLDQYMPALFISKDRPFMRALMSAYEGRTGLPGEFVLAPGTSYAKAMPRIAAFGPILPGHPDLCHEVDERMSFEEIMACALIYVEAISSIVSSTEPMA